MSDIRVSVKWKSSTVFAGEDIEGIITFKNVSQVDNLHLSPSTGECASTRDLDYDRQRETLLHFPTEGQASHSPAKLPSIPTVPHRSAKIHKSALSLSTHRAFAASPAHGEQGVSSTESSSRTSKQRSSVSIVSIGGETVTEARSPDASTNSARPVRGHVRAASLQLLPRSTASNLGEGPHLGSLGNP